MFNHKEDTRDPARICCQTLQGGPGWCNDLQEDFVPGVALASDGQRLFVADYPAISSGARVHAFALADGSLQWTRPLMAIGPQAHSEYFNVVQLRLIGSQLIAYGDEAHGAYVEAMEAHSGGLLAHRTLEAPRPEQRFDEATPEPTATVEVGLDDGGSCRFEHDEDARRSTLSCSAGSKSGDAWQREVEADFIGRGALQVSEDGSRILLVSWCRIANGARAAAYDRQSGALLWSTALEGIGPQDHSKYSNLIQTRVAGELLIVLGRESHGSYREARAIADGALVWSLVEPSF